MSRISRYQDSIYKFIKNKSCLSIIDEPSNKNILNYFENHNYGISIVLLTIVNTISKKNKANLHGFYLSVVFELMHLLGRLNDKDKNNFDLINKINILINHSLIQNNETSLGLIKDKNIKLIYKLQRDINTKILQILLKEEFELEDSIKRTDLFTHKFEEIKNKKNKVKNIKKVTRESLYLHINKKYCDICKYAVNFAWLISGGDEKQIPNIERIGYNLGVILKIHNDLLNLETDIDKSDEFSKNIFINLGIQECFELFNDSKQKIIEVCMKYELYTNTMKEILDFFEFKFDKFLEKTEPDLKSASTIDSCENSLDNNSNSKNKTINVEKAKKYKITSEKEGNNETDELVVNLN